MIDFLSTIGRRVIELFAIAGRLTLFVASALSHCFRPPFYIRNIVQQFWTIGYNSLPVVGLTAVFTGAALAQQIYVGGSRFSAQSAVPGIVVIGIVRELGPVLVANAIGVLGGYLLAVYKLGFNAVRYLETSRRVLEGDDLAMSMVKAAVFGFFIALMGCYHGFRAQGGAAGVGRATTDAVVSAFILILLSNMIITLMAFG